MTASCGGGGEGGSTGPVVTPSFTLESSTGSPGTVMLGTLRAVTVPAGTIVVARVGDSTVSVRRIDDSTLAFVVPTLPTGAQAVSMTLGTRAFGASLQVSAAPIVANPDAYVGTLLDMTETAFASVEGQLSDPIFAGTAADSAALRSELATMRAKLAEARTLVANASPAQRARLAVFLAANAQALGITGATTAAVSVDALRTSSGACVTASGTQLNTAEECSAELTSHVGVLKKKVAIILAISLVAIAESSTGIGIIAGAVTGLVAYQELQRFNEGSIKRFFEPVVAKLQEPFEDENIAESRVGTSRRASMAAVSRSASVPAPEYFVADSTRAFDVQGSYQSLSTADLSRPGISSLANGARQLESVINTVRALFLLSPMRQLVPATPRRVELRRIPAKFLTIGSLTPNQITSRGTATDTEWRVRFSRTGITQDIPFSFDIEYTAPGIPTQTREVPAILIPTPRFIAKSLASRSSGDYACAMSITDQLYCWGSNGAGQLGDGTTTHRLRPVLVSSTLSGVSNGQYAGCGLTSTGAARCWGSVYTPGWDYNSPGTQRALAPGYSFSAIAIGGRMTCGLSGGAARCSGYVTADDINNDSSYVFTTPVPSAASFTKIYAGAQFACALTAAGEPYCWGQNRNGQVGTNSNFFTRAATRIPGGHLFTALSLGDEHACGLKSTGQIWCWGSGAVNATGPNTTSSYNATPLLIPGFTFTHLAAAGTRSCGIATDGKTYCWGSGGGVSTTPTPTHVSGSVTFVELSVGQNVTCGRTAAGALYCWGGSGFGNVLGTGTTVDSYTPAPVTTP